MTAETLTGLRAARKFPAQGAGLTAALVSCWGHYAPTANVEDGDIFEMCRTPDAGAGFLLLGGWWALSDMDTGTEALDMDLGWAANGTSAAATMVTPWGQSFTDSGYSASPTGLVNAGVLTGDAITDLLPAGNLRPIVLSTPLWFAKPTIIQVEANVAANAWANGNMTCCLIGQIL